MLDRERLAKILAMTTSNHDGEALAAVRKANEIIKAEKLTWDQVLVQLAPRAVHVSVHHTRGFAGATSVYEPEESWVPPHLKDKVTLDMMFRKIMEKVVPGMEFREWVDSVYNWYQEHGSVTPKQYNALRQAYTRASR